MMLKSIQIRIILFSYLLAIILTSTLKAQVSGAAYLKLGMDSRGIAVGRAITASAQGAAAIYWNPAGILNGKNRFDFKMTGLMNKSPWDQEYSTISMSYKWRRLALGGGYINYGVYDIPEYDENMGYHGDFNNHEGAGLVTLAIDFPGLVKFGITGFYLMQNYSSLVNADSLPTDRSGYGYNLGLLFNPILHYDRLVIGLLLNDNKLYTTGDASSLITDLGVRWTAWESKEYYFNNVDLLLDFEQERNYPIKLKLGTDIQAINYRGYRLFLRLGVDDLILEMRPLSDSLAAHSPELEDQIVILNRKFMLGFGLQYKTFASANIFSIDYAFVRERYRVLHFLSVGISL